jgi:hypothetical protein
VSNPIACPTASENARDLVPLYLAGKLSETDAEAFETHYLGCAQCREDLQAGAALRELYGKPAVAALKRPAPARRTWLPLAAAAAIALVAVGVWNSRKPAEAPGQPVLRGGSTGGLQVEVTSGPEGSIELSWPPHPNATAYEVQVLATDGVSVWRAEADEPHLRIAPGTLPTPLPDQSFVVEVQALDSMGAVVAASYPTPLPTPR